MRLNEYLFNRVNDKEGERGQRSVVWLKRGQPCLHHLHVLSIQCFQGAHSLRF